MINEKEEDPVEFVLPCPSELPKLEEESPPVIDPSTFMDRIAAVQPPSSPFILCAAVQEEVATSLAAQPSTGELALAPTISTSLEPVAGEELSLASMPSLAATTTINSVAAAVVRTAAAPAIIPVIVYNEGRLGKTAAKFGHKLSEHLYQRRMMRRRVMNWSYRKKQP
ncbi:unnamed protein product [Linum trigynum]